MDGHAEPLISLAGVGVTMDRRPVLQGITWSVLPKQHWVVIGPNGSGKSTMVRVAGLQLHPTTGSVVVLGRELGRTDIRSLRSEVGLASASLADQLRGRLTAEEVVRCGRTGALEPWWHTYTDEDTDRALASLDRVGLGGYGQRTFATLSSGERQRTLLARALVNDPRVLLLDEPTAGLDLTGREELVAALSGLAEDPDGPSTVLVTHHVEDIPPTSTHLMALRQGEAIAAGVIDETLTADVLEQTFGLQVELTSNGGRFSARATPTRP